jgi:hypothetical protein
LNIDLKSVDRAGLGENTIRWMRLSLAVLWLGSGVVSIVNWHNISVVLLSQQHYLSWTPATLAGRYQKIIIIFPALINCCLGVATLFSWQLKKIFKIELLMIIFYTLLASVGSFSLWLHPFGPLLKNIPIMVMTLVMIQLVNKREVI